MANRFKYYHRKLSRHEFNELLNKAGIVLNDFLYITGRNAVQLSTFMKGQNDAYTPTMGDALVLELLARGVISYDSMADIADEYIIDEPAAVVVKK